MGSSVHVVGTKIDLRASPAEGYHFVDWTGEVDTIDHADMSAGGTGKTTPEINSIATFVGWNIVGVANTSVRTISCVWDIVNGLT